MKIGIVGPSDLEKWKELIDINDDFLNSMLDNIVDSIVDLKHEIIIVPTRKSISHKIGSKYKDKNGKKLLSVIPLDDTEFGIEELDEFFCDEIINCVTWRNQPEKLCEESDIILVLGYSPGTVVEIMQNKWFGKNNEESSSSSVQEIKNSIGNKILIIEELITSKLPIESIDKLDIKYIKYDELEPHLLEKKQ